MAGEKITLEVLTKFVDKGLKQAKKEIKQLYNIEKGRQNRSLKDTVALYKAKEITFAQYTRAIIRLGENRLKTEISNNKKLRAHTTTTYKRILAKRKETDKLIAASVAARVRHEKKVESSNHKMQKRWAAQKIALEKMKQKHSAMYAKMSAEQEMAFDRRRARIAKLQTQQVFNQKKRIEKGKRSEARKTANILRRLDRMTHLQERRRNKNALARTKRMEKAKRNEFRKTAQAQKRAQAAIGAGFSRLTGLLTHLSLAAGVVGVAMGALGKKVISVGANFEQSVVNVGAIANMTDAQMRRIGNRARELGASTAFTATEVANGMADLARAGLKANDIIGAIGPTLYLAGAAGADMTQATKLMARTMAQFGLAADDATRVSDTFTLAMQNSLLDIESLDSSMRYAGAAAGAFGWDIGQTTAAVSLFMDQTGMGSTAGTQFRHVLLSLAGPTAAAQKVIRDLAKSQGVTYDVMRKRLNPATSDFGTILENLKPIMKDHDKILKLVNKRSSGTLQKILKDYHTGQSKYDELTAMFAEGGGAALETYDMQMNTVMGKQRIVASKIQEAFIQLFTAASGPIGDFLDSVMLVLDDVILVFDALSARIQYVLQTALASSKGFSSTGANAASMGERIGAFLIQTIQYVAWLIKNIPKILNNLKKWLKPLFKALIYIKAFQIISTIVTLALNLARAVKLVSAALGMATMKARMLQVAVFGVVGILTAIAGMAAESFMTPDLFAGTEDIVDSTEVILEHTAAVRAAKQAYDEFEGRLGGGAEADLSQMVMGQAAESIIENTQDEDIRKAIIDQANLSSEAISDQVKVGKLVMTDSDLVTDTVRNRLKELAETKSDFLVSMETIAAVAKSISDEEFDNFKELQKKKLEELLKYQAAHNRLVKQLDQEGIRHLGTGSHLSAKDREILIHTTNAIKADESLVARKQAQYDTLSEPDLRKLGISGIEHPLVMPDTGTGKTSFFSAEDREALNAYHDLMYVGEYLKDDEDAAIGLGAEMAPQAVTKQMEAIQRLLNDMSEKRIQGKGIKFSDQTTDLLAEASGVIIGEEELSDLQVLDLSKVLYARMSKIEAKLFGLLQDRKLALSTIGENEDERLDALDEILIAAKGDLSAENTLRTLGTKKFEDLSKAISEFYDEQKSYKGVEKEIAGYLEELDLGLTSADIQPFSERVVNKLELIKKTDESIKKEFQNMGSFELDELFIISKDAGDRIAGEVQGALAGTDITEGLLKKAGEEITLFGKDITLSHAQNLSQIMELDTKLLTPLKERMRIVKDLHKKQLITPEQFASMRAQFEKIQQYIHGYQAQLIRGSDEGLDDYMQKIAFAKDRLDQLFVSDPEVTGFLDYLKSIGDYTAGIIGSLLPETKNIPDEPDDGGEAERKRKERESKREQFYKKLFEMEKRQQEKIKDLQDGETKSLINNLNRRLEKVKEFFREGYKIQKDDQQRRLALRRREERLLDQARLEEKLKLQKDSEEKIDQIENQLFNLKEPELNKIKEKLRRDDKEAEENHQKALNLIVEQGSLDRTQILLDETDKMDKTFLKTIDPDAKYKRLHEKTGATMSILALLGIKDDDDPSKVQDIHSIFKTIASDKRELIHLDQLDEDAKSKINDKTKDAINLRNEQINKIKAYLQLLQTDAGLRPKRGEFLAIGGERGQKFRSPMDQDATDKVGGPLVLQYEPTTGTPLSKSFLKAAVEQLKGVTTEERKRVIQIIASFLEQEQIVFGKHLESIRNAEDDYNKDRATADELLNKTKEKNLLEYQEKYKKLLIDPIIEMDKELNSILGNTMGEQLRRRRLEMEKELLIEIGLSDDIEEEYGKRLEFLKKFLELQKAEIKQAAQESDIGIDPFIDFDKMDAKWWKPRFQELATFLKQNDILSPDGALDEAAINTLMQRALDIEKAAMSPDLFGVARPEETRDRMMKEAESLRDLAKTYRDHYTVLKDLRLQYNLDEEAATLDRIKALEDEVDLSDKQREELDYLYDKLQVIINGKELYNKTLEKQKKVEKEAADAAKGAANDLAKGIKAFAEKVEQYWMTAFGPLYIAYKALMAIKNALGSIIGKITAGLDFLTGGNLELNPFTLMSEAAQKLIEHIEQVQEEQKELEELFRAGRISAQEYEIQRAEIDEKSADEIAKETIDEMIEDSIRFMDALIAVAPAIMDELVRQLPKLISALERIIPQFVKILDRTLPIIMPVLIKVFTVAAQVFAKVVGELLGGYMKKKTGNMASGAAMGAGVGGLLAASVTGGLGAPAGMLLGGLIGGAAGLFLPGNGPVTFNDTPGPMKVMSSGFKKYGDTPGPVRVTNSGLLARFAPGDTVIAAKEPQELMRQALMAVGSDIKMGVTKPPSMPSSATQRGDAGGGSRIDIAVIAEGRVLDAVQMQAMERGHAPKIEKRLRKASGVKVGFNRGRYNKFAVNT